MAGEPNRLFKNNSGESFTDVSERAGTCLFGWYLTSSIFDYDNDGRQGVYAVNGWISAKNHEDL